MNNKKQRKKRVTKEKPICILPYQQETIYDVVSIDTIELFIPCKNLKIDKDIFQRFAQIFYSAKRKQWIVNFKKSISGIRIEWKDYFNGVPIMCFTFSVSRLKNAINLIPYGQPNYYQIAERLNEIISIYGMKIEDARNLKISRIDLFKNIKPSVSFSVYSSILRHLKSAYLEFREIDEFPYYTNKCSEIYFYDKTAELKKEKQLDIPDQVIRCEMRINNAEKIYNDLGIKYFTDLFHIDLESYFHSKTAKLLSEISEFDFDPVSNSLEMELFRYYTMKAGAKNPKKIVNESLRIFNLFNSAKYVRFCKIASFSFYSKASPEAKRKRLERFLDRCSRQFVVTNLIFHKIKGNGWVIEEIKEALCNSNNDFIKGVNHPDFVEFKKGLYLHKETIEWMNGTE
ncbi:hypothetical protein [Leptospira interrogans]|uniref:hypothetical protein n=1 Tax=Leptospira interrogans TaxID=173 RepID=UPI000513AB62|nr:hypothetical protein [Leptospira interrogans]KGE21940.1 hypothetical protein IQ65_21475 [Leptospira interrogans serovar Lai]